MATPWAIEPSAALCGLIPPKHTLPDPNAPRDRLFDPMEPELDTRESRSCLKTIHSSGSEITPSTEIIPGVRAGLYSLYYVRSQQRKREQKKRRKLAKQPLSFFTQEGVDIVDLFSSIDYTDEEPEEGTLGYYAYNFVRWAHKDELQELASIFSENDHELPPMVSHRLDLS